MNKKSIISFLIVVVLMSCITATCVSCLILSSRTRDKKEVNNSTNSIPVHHTSQMNEPNGNYIDLTYASERSIHAVVHVKTVSYIQERRIASPLEFFFGSPFYDYQPRQQIGMGSGVIISSNGYIVTNNHVISGASGIEVTLNNKQVYSATVIGSDPTTDIALIKIEADNLAFLNFGNSDDLKVGEWVLAVGNPFNLTSTVTAGIVSAKGRNLGIISGSMGIESFIQTDAAVNAGNSGGALVNIKGELIGINTAIASPTGNFSGYSFAVPASITQKVVEDLMQYGAVQRAVLSGVELTDLDAANAEQYNIHINDYRGVLVTDVNDGSAAAKAGLSIGDIIVKINDKEVESITILQEQISRYRPGDKVRFNLIHNNKEKQITILLNNRIGGIGLVSTNDELEAIFGAQFKEITQKEAYRYNVDCGLQITSLKEGILQESGVRRTYIILRVNNIEICSVEALKQIIDKTKKNILLEGFYPNGQVVYYNLRI